MTSYSLAILALCACSWASSYAASSSLTVSPDHRLMVAKDEYKINCEISGEGVHGGELLTLQANKLAALKIANGLQKLAEKDGEGFLSTGYRLQTSTDGDKSKINITVTIAPEKAGEFLIKCMDKTKTYFVVDAARPGKEAALKELSCEFNIPKSQIEGVDVEKTAITLVQPTHAKQDFSAETNKNCSGDVDSTSVRFCYKVTPKAGSLVAGRYRFELRSGSDVIASASQDVFSQKLEIKDCAPTAGSNCIADSEFCSFKCVIVGWPVQIKSCEVTGMGELPAKNERMHVDCESSDQYIKITLAKPTQDDSGTYNVSAIGGSDSQMARADLLIRVKDKLAPLWPFLGICAEVLVLCGIILFFEKRHQKKLQQEQDQGEASEPMVKSSGKGGNEVRQRAAKA